MLQAITTIVHWAMNHWGELSVLFGGGAGLSIALQVVLHKLHIDSKKLAYTLIHLFSMAGALAAFYLDNAQVMPAYASLVIVAQTVHRFIISPYYTKYVLPYLNFLSESAATAADEPAYATTANQSPQSEAQAELQPSFVN